MDLGVVDGWKGAVSRERVDEAVLDAEKGEQRLEARHPSRLVAVDYELLAEEDAEDAAVE